MVFNIKMDGEYSSSTYETLMDQSNLTVLTMTNYRLFNMNEVDGTIYLNRIVLTASKAKQ